MKNFFPNFDRASKKQFLVVLGIYFLIFAIFFISYPLHDSLPTDQDSWYYIACFNHYSNYLVASFQGVPTSSFFYPDSYPILNGEPSFSLYLLWLPFKLLVRSDLWAYFLLLASILSLNALAVFELIQSFFPKLNKRAAFIGGLIFNLNMFMFANLDNVNTLFWASGIIAIVLFHKILKAQNKAPQLIILLSILVLFQLTACVYNFLYTILVLGVYFIFHFKNYFSILSKNLWINLPLVLSGIVISYAYLYFIAIYPQKIHHWNFSQNLETLNLVSINFKDFTRALPNTLYGGSNEVSWILQYQSFFFGFAFILSGFAGLLMKFKDKKMILSVLLISLTIGFGGYIELFNTRLLLPLGLLFEQFDLYGFYRFPFRIVLVIVLMWILLISQFFNFLEKLTSKKVFYSLLVLFLAIFMLENIPYKRNYFEFNRYEQEKDRLKQTFENQTSKTILILPVEDFINQGADVNIYRSEHIYMYWQTAFNKNLINGQSSHSPPHMQELIKSLFYSHNIQENFGNYLNKYKIEVILFYGEDWGFMHSRLDFEEVRAIAQANDVEFQYIN